MMESNITTGDKSVTALGDKFFLSNALCNAVCNLDVTLVNVVDTEMYFCPASLILDGGEETDFCLCD